MHGAIPLEIQFPRPVLLGEFCSERRIDAISIRLLDVVLATLALITFLPLLVLIMAAVYFSDPGPVFFAHWRIGRGGTRFPCFKFRSMAVDAEARLARLLAEDPVARAEWEHDFKLRNDPRITPIGRFLRKSSLDELPQLLNVIRGEMSLVGPRPIVSGEVPRYNRYIAYYCACRPGITGLWQISGRNDTSYRRRVALDVTFVRSRSLGLHLKILALTLPCVIFARGSY